jgi:hypothetical protein
MACWRGLGFAAPWFLQSSSLVEELEQLEQRKRAIETRFSMFTAAQPAPTRSSPQASHVFSLNVLDSLVDPVDLALLDLDPFWKCGSSSRSKGL